MSENSEKDSSKSKSWSREVATAMFLHLVYLSYSSIEALNIVVWPYISFMIYAFGSKQKVIQDLVDSKIGNKEYER